LLLVAVVFSSGDGLAKKFANVSRQSAAIADHRFQFQKRRQLFIRSHHEPFSIIAMCVSYEDSLAARIDG
jgi:hypothetical protein